MDITPEEKKKLVEAGEDVLKLEVEIAEDSEKLKDKKTSLKEKVDTYRNLRRYLERKEKATTLEDFNEGEEEEPQDFDESCPECNSSNIQDSGLLEGEKVCNDCGRLFTLTNEEDDELDVVCPKCEPGDCVEFNEEKDVWICQDCGSEFAVTKLERPENEVAFVDEDPELHPPEDEEAEKEPNWAPGDEPVDQDVLKWLTGTPAGDINFKGNLAKANLATVNHAIELAEGRPSGQVTRLKALNTRKNQLEKELA